MRKVLFISVLVALFGAVSACGQKSGDLKETALELCQYIPDHGIAEGSEEHMTKSFYEAVSAAFDAPDGAYGEIGDSEWLFYFLTGNDPGTPIFEVQSVTMHGKDQADAIISVQEKWEYDGETQYSDETNYYTISIAREDGRWKLDDFDNKKQECLDYVAEMRKKYANGEILNYLRENEYSREFIPDFLAAVQEFYQKHGK